MELLYPPRCVICEKRLSIGQYVCVSCRGKLPFVGDKYCLKCGKLLENEDEYCGDCRRKKHYFTQGISLWTYSPLLKKSLYRFKYNNKKYYAKYYGCEIERRYRSVIEAWNLDGIIPVPLYKAKERKRGYNQAVLIGKELSKRFDVPLVNGKIVRIRNTTPQKQLNDIERYKNLKGAFKNRKSMVKLKRVLLVDDIFTTGSTADEISRVLINEGVERVYVVSLCIGKGY